MSLLHCQMLVGGDIVMTEGQELLIFLRDKKQFVSIAYGNKEELPEADNALGLDCIKVSVLEYHHSDVECTHIKYMLYDSTNTNYKDVGLLLYDALRFIGVETAEEFGEVLILGVFE